LTFSLRQVDPKRYPIKVLPVDLPDRPSEFGIITLKNRTLSPVAECFIEYVREFTRPMYKKPAVR
jgi:DNA-binding transcriptional LysR family regulator